MYLQPNRKIIGLCGKAGVGKDTIANEIVSMCKVPYAQIAFAKPLKDFVSRAFGLTQEQLNNQSQKIAKLSDETLDFFTYKIFHTCRQMPEIAVFDGMDFDDAIRVPSMMFSFLVKVEGARAILQKEPVTPRRLLQVVGTEIFRSNNPHVWVDCLHQSIIKDSTSELIIVTDCRFQNEVKAVNDIGGKVIVVNGDSIGAPSHASEDLEITGPIHLTVNNPKVSDRKAQIRDIALTILESIP